MSCALHPHGTGTRARVLCFECHRSRIVRPERVSVLAAPFARILTDREVAHRRRMLMHLTGRKDSRGDRASRQFPG